MLLQQLEFFCELTKHKSITSGATSLHTTQSNLSQSIMNLENYLDQTLFFRSNKGISLTPIGYDILSHSKQILSFKNQMVQISQGKKRGLLNLSSYLFLINSIPLKRFQAIYDHHTTLTFEELLTPNLLQNVARMSSEIGFIQLANQPNETITELIEHLNLELELLYTDSWYINFRTNHPLALQQRITPTDLKSFQLILPDTPKTDTPSFKPFISTPPPVFNFDNHIYFNNSLSIVNYLHHSDAFFLAPGLTKTDFKRFGLVSKPLSLDQNTLKIYLVKIKNAPLSSEAILFLGLFKDYLKNL